MATKRLLVGAALVAGVSGALVGATPGSGTQSTLLGRGRFQAGKVAAWIDKGRLVGGGAPEQGAILLQWGDGNDRGFKGRSGHDVTDGEG